MKNVNQFVIQCTISINDQVTQSSMIKYWQYDEAANKKNKGTILQIPFLLLKTTIGAITYWIDKP